MSLAGVPEGYISLPEARGQVSEAIAEAAGHNVAALKKILDPDEVEKGPPRAISNAAFKALYKPVGQGKLDVFTMHPSSGAIVRVPVLVFLNAKAPRELFSSPSPPCAPQSLPLFSWLPPPLSRRPLPGHLRVRPRCG